MKAIFIYPQCYNEPYPERFPVSLLTLAALSEQEGHIVGILDMNALRARFTNKQALKNDMAEGDWNDTDVIVVSCDQHQYSDARWTVTTAKETRPTALRVLVGGLPSAMPEEAMALLPDADLAVIGEPEETWPEVLRRADSRRFGEVRGIVYRQKGGLRKTEPRPLNKKIDELPLPAYKLMDGEMAESYFQGSAVVFPSSRRRIYVHGQRGSLRDKGYTGGYSRWDMVRIWGYGEVRKMDQAYGFQRPVRFHSVEYLVKHAEFLRKHYGVDFISFLDADFMADKKRVEAFCEEYMKKELYDCLRWSCNGWVANASHGLLRRMKDAGCRYVAYNMVSNSQSVLEADRWGTTPAMNHSAVEAAMGAEIGFGCVFNLASRHEQVDDLLEDMAFAKRHGLRCEAALTPISIGSKDFEQHRKCVSQTYPVTEKGDLAALDAMLSDGCMVSPCHTFTMVELTGLQQLMFRGSIRHILAHAHRMNRRHSEKWDNECPRCSSIQVKQIEA